MCRNSLTWGSPSDVIGTDRTAHTGGSMHRWNSSRSRLTAVVFALVAVAVAAFAATVLAAVAFVDLDGRVDSDKPAGIDPKQDPGALDAQGGSDVAGAPNVPWTDFEKKTSTKQQIFARSFNGTDWETEGHGTV